MNVHLIGIGGSGLSAIARLLLELGHGVSGSDREDSPVLQGLRDLGARVTVGHHPDNVRGADRVVRSSAVPDDNVEVQAALEAGIPVLKRSDFLGRLMEDRLCIAVAGSHGKTTTTGMIAWALTRLGEDPSYLVGGWLQDLDSNAHAGDGRAFVVEADEYDYMFLGLRPRIAVVTNIEHDHPDFFPTPEDFYRAFLQFSGRVSPDGTLVVCVDDPGASRLRAEVAATGRRTVTYGLTGNADYGARGLHHAPEGGLGFYFLRGETALAHLTLQIPGEHNVRNAMAALIVVDQLGLSVPEAARALEDFRGVGRRFEARGQVGGVLVVDDYAHHPTEIQATLQAARGRYSDREIWAVWQPHTYSRTRVFFSDYLSVFEDADHVLVTEVYPAREPIPPDFSARQIVEAMSHTDAAFASDLDAAVALLETRLAGGEVVLVLSAGDGEILSERLLARLEEKRGEYV